MRTFVVGFFLVVGVFITLAGQSVLQYSKVIDTSFAFSGTSSLVTSVNIPTGKVWKVEAVGLYSVDTTSGSPRPVAANGLYGVFIGDQMVFRLTQDGLFSSIPYQVKLPLWIKAGLKEIRVAGPFNQQFSYRVSVSAIEFDE